MRALKEIEQTYNMMWEQQKKVETWSNMLGGFCGFATKTDNFLELPPSASFSENHLANVSKFHAPKSAI